MKRDATESGAARRQPVLPGWLAAFAFAVLVLAGAAAAHAEAPPAAVVVERATQRVDLAGQVDILPDPDASLDIAAVRAAALAGRFAPAPQAGGDLDLGYSNAAHWLLFRVEARADASAATDGDWLLEVGFPLLDDVAVYVGDAREPMRAGGRLPFAERPYPHRNLVFPLPLHAGETTTVILRVQSGGSLTVPLTLWSTRAFALHDQRAYAALALYYGALAALLLYNLLLCLSLRDRSYLEYALLVAGIAVGLLSLNGLGSQFAWPRAMAWGHLALPAGIAFSAAFALMLTRSFLATKRAAPWLDRLLLLTIVLCGGAFAAVFAVPFRHSAAAVSLLGTAAALLAVVGGVRGRRVGRPGAGPYLFAWIAILFGAVAIGARQLGWLPAGAIPACALQAGSAGALLLLSFALADRTRVLRRESAAAQAEALAAKERLVSSLRRSEQMLALHVNQRTRELEAANQRLQESEQRLQHMAHHDPLTGLANRLLLDDRIAQAIHRAKRHNCRIALLLVALDGFKPVNDALGRVAGDELLTTAGRRLMAIVRAEDTIARVGGDAFVIVLEEVFERDDAARVAAAVERELGRAFEVGGQQQARVGASVGAALYPEDGKDGAALLKFAEKLVYRAKEAKRDARPQAATS